MMKIYKKAVAVLAVSSLFSVCAHASQEAFTQNAIKDVFNSMGGTWTPFLVDVADGKALILLEQQSISLDFFLVALPTGVCALSAQDGYLSTVREVAILNSAGDQGYVFEGGREACARVYRESGGYSDALIRARTREHVVQ